MGFTFQSDDKKIFQNNVFFLFKILINITNYSDNNSKCKYVVETNIKLFDLYL